MTKKIRNTIQWLLVAVMSVAVVLGAGALVVKPTTAKAAEVAVTFSAACLGDASHETYGTSIRFDTAGLQWETYHNWVSASDWTSIADYTTVNGRTVTEINNATTHTQKITLMMQPTGSFSFLRLYIPAEIIPLGEVKSMGILDGWSFNNGTNNYTTSAVTFLRNGDTMVESSSFSAVTKLSASDITIGDAQLVNPIDANRGADSYFVNIDIGQRVAGEYETMYDQHKSIRNAIYINGKSIEEWNSQKIAEDSRFKDPATYSTFPQNSTEPTHLDPFVKPVCLWATDTGFRLSIFQELVADCETITVSVGAGCISAGKFMVAETVTKTVLTQGVVDVTDKLTFLDNSHNAPADWGATNLYYIHTNDEACWTKRPIGGCLNECDPAGTGGGQVQLKYIYFNGTSVYDINKNDDGTYGSTQGNIANGGAYAPIFADMTSELGSSLKLTVPTAYTNGKSGHEEIIIKKGFSVVENGVSYYVSNDIVFTKNGSSWDKEIKGNEIATEVTGIITKANRTDGGNNENFVIFQLSNNDYAGCNTTAITDISSLFGYIDIGGTVIESYSGEKFFNVWNIQNSVAFRFENVATLQNVAYITIKAGAKFPSYNTQHNGAPLTYYVTSEDVTFVHDVPNDTWTVGAQPKPTYTVTFTVDEATYHTETVEEGSAVDKPADPTKAEDETYTYTFKYWTLNGVEYNFATAITGDITLVAEFTKEAKENTVDITSELQFAHQSTSNNTETYLIKTKNNYWTKAPQGGCLNEYDPEDLGGGQEQMKYIYFNGTSLYDINKNDNGLYNSAQGNIANGGIYAPILATMGTDNEAYSYIQICVPTEYPNMGATANENHRSFEIKAGFSVKEGTTTYTVTKDLKWVNLNGSWVNADNTFEADSVAIDNPRIDGVAKELYKVDITSDSWNITCNNYDFMYDSYAAHRKFIFINGVSVYDINANTDDSGYVYSTFPMTGADDATFAYPIIIQTNNQEGDPNTVTLWMHKNYIESLGEEIIITLGAGYNAFTDGKSLAENVDYDMVATVEVDDGTSKYTQKMIKGTSLKNPSKPMTEDTIYTFEGWYNAVTDTAFDGVITEDVSVEARFTETKVDLIETEVVGIIHYLKTSDDNWLAFELSEHDYDGAAENYDMGGYQELLRTGFLDNVILKGTIVLNNGSIVSEASLMDIYNSYGAQQGPLLNFWNVQKFALRLPVGDGVEEIIIKEGTYFPSYKYVSGQVTTDTRYVVLKESVYKYDEEMGAFVKQAAISVDINMEFGAAVRIKNDLDTSGIRFRTNISEESLKSMQKMIEDGKYSSISFGTLIIPTEYLVGGRFTHEWLDKNDKTYLDIESSSTLEDYANTFAGNKNGYYYFYGSIVKMLDANYSRAFSGIGYIKFVKGEDVEYVYAPYDSTNSRTAEFVARAAISDRNDKEEGDYKYLIDGSYSPYTSTQHGLLAQYIKTNEEDGEVEIDLGDSFTLKKDNPYNRVVNQELVGPYVELTYSTTIDVWGTFVYTDGSKTVEEDFYLQQGTTTHRQYLDIFRYNGVGYGMNTSNLTMNSITFKNAELDADSSGEVKIFALSSFNKTIDTANQEIYLTVEQNDGSEMTVGAHLGIGGALTYLAKSGIYEGVIGGSSGWKNGTVALSTDPSVFDSTNRYKSGSSSSSYSTEAGYYGHATSSRPADGAVNLINNFDAGRQIQQSWYAQVGGSDTATDGSNGYTRAYCYTGSTTGQYWPYNPVQAGDVVSNPGQIVDYEVNEAKGYIYVKARAMDWAKGYDPDNPCENAVEGGVTTKSYVENYYRLNADGTLVVDNRFIDWNGFTDMETCGWASTELPAVYPIQTLNYYVSNTNGDGTWEDALEYNNSLGAWTGGNAYHQFANPANGDTKVEDWFAWANGGNGSAFAMGMYIPNVNRYTSGRSYTSTAYYTDVNFQNSNALPVANYTEFNWSSFKNVDMVSDFAERGNILADKGMMSNMQEIKYTYQSAYVSNTSYTAPGIDFRMEAYVPIEYSYVICLNTVDNIRSTFKAIKDKGTVTNAGNGYEKVGLDAWARADKTWTW